MGICGLCCKLDRAREREREREKLIGGCGRWREGR